MSGDAFAERPLAHGAFAADGTVLDVGPGYGRILRSCLDRGVPFARYIGLDLSPGNVAHLRQEFADPRIEFIEGDVERTSLPSPVDTVISSLTFKHLYPSFEAALANLRRQLSDRGRVVRPHRGAPPVLPLGRADLRSRVSPGRGREDPRSVLARAGGVRHRRARS